VFSALIAALLARGAEPDALTGPSRITWVTEANFGMAPPPEQPATALPTAAKAGQADAMWQLIRAGAGENFVDGAGVNVVLAAEGRSAPALALDLAPDANVADKQNATALHMLAGGPWFEDLAAMLRLLSSHGARTDLADGRGKTALEVLNDGLATVQTVFHDVFPAQLPQTQPPKALAQFR
jgi:ankyrin repeat protein